MLTSILIAPKADQAGDLSTSLMEYCRVRILRTFQQYPTEEELGRVLQVEGPAIVFLGSENKGRAISLALAVDKAATGAQVVLLTEACEPQFLVECMQVGIREVLPLPLSTDSANQTMCRVESILDRKPLSFNSTDAVFSFLPAKPGDGSSTVALNVSSAIARRGLGKTLLADFDLNLGMVSFLLKITNGRSVLDAISVAERMDDLLWENLVLKRDNMDLLCSGRLDPKHEVDLSCAEQLLNYARRTYKTICLDLSGNMEVFSLPLLAQSREIFIVGTSDVPSLHFARAKAQFLRESGFGDRTSVLINRSERMGALSTEELEEILGTHIRFTFQNDPKRVSDAMRAGVCVEQKSALGRQFESFADNLLSGERPTAPASHRRRFVEYFAILPSMYDSVTGKNH